MKKESNETYEEFFFLHSQKVHCALGLSQFRIEQQQQSKKKNDKNKHSNQPRNVR